MRITLFLTFSLLLFSCKKEKAPDPVVDCGTPAASIHSIRAGIYDTTFTHVVLSPAFTFNLSWDSQNLYGSGSDSLDLDQDGSVDLFLNISLLNPDSLHLLPGMPNPFPYFSLTTNGNMEFVQRTETVPAGLGTTVTYHWADTLHYNEEITENSNWYISSAQNIKLWGENPGTIGTVVMEPGTP